MPTLREVLEQARWHHEAGRLAQAQELYQEVLRQEPNLADVWQMLADARQAQGKYAEAAAAYENVLRLQPDHPDARTSLGVALAQQGKLDEAVAMQIGPGPTSPDNGFTF